MIVRPSAAWLRVFPGPRIPDVLAYVSDTWDSVRQKHSAAVAFDHDETVLTDNLCEALNSEDRRRSHSMDCDFQPETWQLKRNSRGETERIARADIRVILGCPGTPHLILEFKKLDGSNGARWRYCFDGVIRFVDGKYANGHPSGIMCGFTPNDPVAEASQLARYIGKATYARRLACVADALGNVITQPSSVGRNAAFDTQHRRATAGPIVLSHAILICPGRAPRQIARKRRQIKKK